MTDTEQKTAARFDLHPMLRYSRIVARSILGSMHPVAAVAASAASCADAHELLQVQRLDSRWFCLAIWAVMAGVRVSLSILNTRILRSYFM